MDIIIPLLAVLGGLIIGIGAGYYSRKVINRKRIGEAKEEAVQVVETARDESRALLIEAKEDALKLRSEGEAEIRVQRTELNRSDQRLANREENLDRRAD
ncbi:Rnase Y domain-containing protein, partial [Dehalococcoidia bacterium]|nr:Rnase Y domain-containing protein [Dehalococcoidia bacterium]